jgi:hypothetical protein
VLAALPLAAHDPIGTKLTWTRDISRIVNRRCIACHDAGAKVPLSTYETARPWAKAIRDQVMTRKMPPWGAVPGYGPDLAGDPSLSQMEIDTVVRWVEGAAPQGDEIWLPHAKPAPPTPRPTLSGPFVKVSGDWRAPRNFQLVGIHSDGREMRITLTRPNGAVEPVIWVHDYPAKGPDFVFAAPLPIPAGSELRVRGDVHAEAALKLIPAGARPLPPEKASRK